MLPATLLVAGLVFARVPDRTTCGVGGVWLASPGAGDDSSVAATAAAAVVVMSAAMAARGASFTRCSSRGLRPSATAAATGTEEPATLQIHRRPSASGGIAGGGQDERARLALEMRWAVCLHLSAEFARVLRPGGNLVISDIHHELVTRGSVITARGPAGQPWVAATYRHQLGDYLRPALSLGLQVRRCEEPGHPDGPAAARARDRDRRLAGLALFADGLPAIGGAGRWRPPVPSYLALPAARRLNWLPPESCAGSGARVAPAAGTGRWHRGAPRRRAGRPAIAGPTAAAGRVPPDQRRCARRTSSLAAVRTRPPAA